MYNDFHILSAARREKSHMARITKSQSSSFSVFSGKLLSSSSYMSDLFDFFASAAVGQLVMGEMATAEG